MKHLQSLQPLLLRTGNREATHRQQGGRRQQMREEALATGSLQSGLAPDFCGPKHLGFLWTVWQIQKFPGPAGSRPSWLCEGAS